jgi:hypothetical protein
MKVGKDDNTEFNGVDVWVFSPSLMGIASEREPPPSQVGNFITLIQKCHIQAVNSSPYLGHTETG